jgi:hypothetical protein
MKAATNEAIDSTLNVKNVLTTKGKWNLNFLKNNLSLNVVNQLVALPKPRDTYGPDIVGWRGTNTHHFTVQSAYELQRENIPQMEADWTMIWNWKGPHRIQTFMWLATHDRLLTNYRWSKWNVGISPICHSCGNGEETTVHTLRDCVYATRIWLKLVASNHTTIFFFQLQGLVLQES